MAEIMEVASPSGDPVEGHTLRAVDQALSDLRLRTLTLGSLVIEQVHAAAASLLSGTRSQAQRVLEREPQVNEMSRDIDHRVFEAIALRQLVAGDLRLARAISRIVIELERVGDECKKLARIALRLQPEATAEPLKVASGEIRHMAELAEGMLRDGLRGLDEASLQLAGAVADKDREVDREFSNAVRLLLNWATKAVAVPATVVDAVFAVKGLERIGDHAKNIAEQVELYLSGDFPITSLSPL